MRFSFRSHIAIDLGSYKVRIAEYKTETLLDEIHALVIKHETGQIMQVGNAIKELNRYALAEELGIIWPMRNGMIDDDWVTRLNLTHHRRKLSKSARFIKPLVVTSIPFSATFVGRKTVEKTVSDALRAKKVYLIQDVLIATIGAELDPVSDKFYFMLLIGAEVSSIGVIKHGSIRFGKQLPYAGNWLDIAIQRHLYQTKGLWIGTDSCRQIKHEVGTLAESDPSRIWRKRVWLKDRSSKVLSLTSEDITPALEKGLAPLVEELYWFCQELPKEVQEALYKQGILLAGGMAYLSNLDQWLSQKLNCSVNVVSEPDFLVFKGLQHLLAKLGHVFYHNTIPKHT